MRQVSISVSSSATGHRVLVNGIQNGITHGTAAQANKEAKAEKATHYPQAKLYLAKVEKVAELA